VFSELIDQDRAEPIREELRWLTGELDGARNWDVFVLQTLPSIVSAFPEHAGFPWLTSHSTELRQQANVKARAAVASTRYQRFLLTFGSWLATGTWRAQRTPLIIGATDPLLTEFAARVLQSRHRRLKKRGRSWETQTPTERHQLRIAAKKLRYASEFFSSLYPRKRTRRYIGALAQLQDLLGAMNDAATTISLMQGLSATALNTEQQQVINLVSGWVLGYSQAQRAALDTAWQSFLNRKTFWS
jgi:CHAD domain-containing protein